MLRGTVRRHISRQKEKPKKLELKELKFIERSEKEDLKMLEKDKERIMGLHPLMELMYCKEESAKAQKIMERFLKHKEVLNGINKKSTNVS